jgi:hypothetical protein
MEPGVVQAQQQQQQQWQEGQHMQASRVESEGGTIQDT